MTRGALAPITGSSPRARGRRGGQFRGHGGSGFIPARAGSTGSRTGKAFRSGVHPHARGGEVSQATRTISHIAPSPRTRGGSDAVRAGAPPLGRSVRASRSSVTGSPHARGETVSLCRAIPSLWFIPARAGELHGGPADGSRHDRCIPAHAEPKRAAGRRGKHSPVHPGPRVAATARQANAWLPTDCSASAGRSGATGGLFPGRTSDTPTTSARAT